MAEAAVSAARNAAGVDIAAADASGIAATPARTGVPALPDAAAVLAALATPVFVVDAGNVLSFLNGAAEQFFAGSRAAFRFFETGQNLTRPAHDSIRQARELGDLNSVRPIRGTRLDLM